MGHRRLGTLPCSRPWKNVVELIGIGAGAGQVAGATLRAANQWLRDAHRQLGVVRAVRLLMLLPHAARSDDFTDALRSLGLDVPDEPGLIDVLAAAAARFDADTPANVGRTDLVELAQAAAVESVAAVLGPQLSGLFGADAADVRAAFARHATVKNFGTLAHEFFSRLTEKYLSAFLSRALQLHVGDGERFPCAADKDRFDREFTRHCRERAVIVQKFAGDWLKTAMYEAGGELTEVAVSDFVYGAMAKLTAELQAAEAA